MLHLLIVILPVVFKDVQVSGQVVKLNLTQALQHKVVRTQCLVIMNHKSNQYSAILLKTNQGSEISTPQAFGLNLIVDHELIKGYPTISTPLIRRISQINQINQGYLTISTTFIRMSQINQRYLISSILPAANSPVACPPALLS